MQNIFIRRFNEASVCDFFLILLLALITLYPLFYGGFTTHDDANFAINVWRGLTWDFTKGMSEGQGRFQFLWGIPLWSVSYIIDNRFWYLFTKYGVVLLLLLAIYYSTSKIFRSGWLGVVCVSFYLAFVQNGWEHNALTSYPFLFNAYAIFFLMSLGLLASALDKNNINLAYIAGILYFFSLGIELFILFFPILFGIIFLRFNSDVLVSSGKNFLNKYYAAIIIPVILYLIFYFLWRNIFPSNYEGLKIAEFSFANILRVVLTYSLTSFPTTSLNLYKAPGDPIFYTSVNNLHAIVSQLNVVHVIKPIVCGFLFARLMVSKKFTPHSSRVYLVSGTLAGISIFIPNLLLGLTVRHQSWVNGGTYSYVYTYYSFIGTVFFFGILLAYIVSKTRDWRVPYRWSIFILIIVSIMTLSFFVEIRNQYFAFDQKLAHRKWQLVDVLLESPGFAKIPDGSEIRAPTLLANRGYAFVSKNDWIDYIKYKTNKTVKVLEGNCENFNNCYTLVFRQASDSDDQFIVFGNSSDFQSAAFNEVAIYSMPIHRDSIITGSYVSNVVKPVIEINGIPVTNRNLNQFSAKLPVAIESEDLQIATLKTNSHVIFESIDITKHGIKPRLRSISEEMADGIDFKEHDFPDFVDTFSGFSSAESFGRWTDANVGSSAVLKFKQPLPKNFTVEILATAFGPNMNSNAKLRAGGVERSFLIKPNNTSDPVRIYFSTDGLVDSLIITPSKPISPNEIDSKNPDKRVLGLGLISLKIKIEN